MKYRGRVLVVEDDAAVRFGLASGLRAKGYEVFEGSTCAEARVVFAQRGADGVDVILMDLQLPDGEAFDLLPLFRSVEPPVPSYIITGNATIPLAVRAVKEGAEDFFMKPVSLNVVLDLVDRAVDKAQLRRAAQSSGARRRFLPETRSPAMLRLEDQVQRLQNADCAVLILGETGTGKSVLAQRIHAIGARNAGPFIDVNCAVLTKEFVESELFGHERGAFTGAHAAKAGLLDAAHGGTIFLDEIGDIDLQVQPKILKVLEQKRFRRMGDVKERTVDVRLVAATHHDLLAAVAQKSFRADLYYRISTVTLTVPPLRERREDILLLATEMLARFGDGSPIELSRRSADKLLEYPWPGNIRELKNVIERALLLRRGREITPDDLRFDVAPATPLPPYQTATGYNFSAKSEPVSSSMQAAPPVLGPGLASGGFGAGPASVSPNSVLLKDAPAHAGHPSSSRLLAVDASAATREEIEREHIRLALEAEHGRVEAAARRLGIPRSTLYWKLKNYGIATGSRPRIPRAEKITTDDPPNDDDGHH